MSDEKDQKPPKANETRAAKSAQDNQAETAQAAATDSKPAANAPTDGRVIRATRDERDDVKMADLSSDTSMVVDENIYQEFYPANTRRPSYRLLFHKGQVVMKSQYDAAVKNDA